MRRLVFPLLLVFLTPVACDGPDVPLAMARDRQMTMRDVKQGMGTAIGEGSRIEAHYEGRFPDGEVFMSTRKSGKPHAWTVGDGSVIAGMDEAVRGMRRGGVRVVNMPPEMHWGNGGYGGVIPPDTWLEFTIEITSVR